MLKNTSCGNLRKQIRTSSRAFSTCSSSLTTASASMTAPHPDPRAPTPRQCHWEPRSREEEGSIRPVLVVILCYLLFPSLVWLIGAYFQDVLSESKPWFCCFASECVPLIIWGGLGQVNMHEAWSYTSAKRLWPAEDEKHLQAGQKTALASESLSDGSQHLRWIFTFSDFQIFTFSGALSAVERICVTWGRCSWRTRHLQSVFSSSSDPVHI